MAGQCKSYYMGIVFSSKLGTHFRCVLYYSPALKPMIANAVAPVRKKLWAGAFHLRYYMSDAGKLHFYDKVYSCKCRRQSSSHHPLHQPPPTLLRLPSFSGPLLIMQNGGRHAPQNALNNDGFCFFCNSLPPVVFNTTSSTSRCFVVLS
jgi:hypothetical protein